MVSPEYVFMLIDDMVADFLYYDRDDDPDLSRTDLQQAIRDGVVTIDEIVARFRTKVREGLRSREIVFPTFEADTDPNAPQFPSIQEVIGEGQKSMPDVWRGVMEMARRLPRVHLTVTLLELRDHFPGVFQRLAQRFTARESTGDPTLDTLFEQLRSPDVVPPGKKKPVGGRLHPELQMLRDALEEVGS